MAWCDYIVDGSTRGVFDILDLKDSSRINTYIADRNSIIPNTSSSFLMCSLPLSAHTRNHKKLEWDNKRMNGTTAGNNTTQLLDDNKEGSALNGHPGIFSDHNEVDTVYT